MGALAALKSLNRDQRAAFIAAFLGWMLDAFDFFLMVFVVGAIAKDFQTKREAVAACITLTLVCRPVGALLFGWLADRFGRRRILMIDVMLFATLELASAFAPSLTVLLILRALFGVAMGGEWGLGSSLVMETVPAKARGVVSGILQEGYAFGYLFAAIVYGLFFDLIGWRGMFAVGFIPALLVVYLRYAVKESTGWQRIHDRPARLGLLQSLLKNWKLLLYVIALMTAFYFFSHGTQDLYPTFLQEQRKLTTHMVSMLAIVANLGAIVGGTCFGAWSQTLGRRRTMMVAALFALPVIPLWAFASTPALLALGAFLTQIAVQGAWGVIPAHLNEISPEEIRGTFPGFASQLGNVIASSNAVLQTRVAAHFGGNYALALAGVAVVSAVVIAILASVGKEAREAVLSGPANEGCL